MFKENKTLKVGDWVTTKKSHSSFRGTMLRGSKVKIIDIDPIRGYGIQDEDGNRVVEIGWEI